MIDLHTHSTKSDGSDQPFRIPELAKEAQCSAFALTDHDTLAGLAEARTRADELGIALIPGCEVSCAFKGKSAHVLVYFVDIGEGPLQDELAELRDDRIRRNRALIEKLAGLDVPITYDEAVAEASSEESLGRPHIAKILVRNGAAEDIQDAFNKYLGEGSSAYVPKARLTPAEVAVLARDSGGVTVLAHPLTLKLDPPDLANAVAELAEAGFAGIEAIYGRYTPEQRKGLSDLARTHDLVATGGSDHHGLTKPDLTVGTGTGDLKVPDDVIERLAARRPA